MYNKKEIPEEWKIAIINLIHNKGDRNDCKNYKGINLLTGACKLYEYILTNRLRDELDELLKQQQRNENYRIKFVNYQ